MNTEEFEKMLLAKAYAKLGKIAEVQKQLKSCTNKQAVNELMEIVMRKALDNLLPDPELPLHSAIPVLSKELEEVYMVCKQLDMREFFFSRVTPLFPVNAYVLLGKDYFVTSRIKVFKESFIDRLKMSVSLYDDDYMNLCYDFLKESSLDDIDLHCAVADSLIKIGYVKEGIGIYDIFEKPYPRKVLRKTAKARFGENPEDAADCYFYLKSTKGLEKVLSDTLSEESSESETSRYIIELILKLQE